MKAKISHLHITRKKGIAGGRPIITGTRTPVRSIVIYHKMGATPEEIKIKLPHLSLAQIYDALAYYYDNKQEIEKEIDEDSEENIRKAFKVADKVLS